MDTNRVKEFGEVFTPPELVNEILDKLPEKIWEDPTKTWLDPTCGNGAFLVEIQNRLLKHHKPSHILNDMLYGVDIQEDNAYECIIKLYNIKNTKRIDVINTKKDMISVSQDNNYILGEGIISLFMVDMRLVKNFVCADGLIYQYNFGTEVDIHRKDIGKNSIQERLF
jgi:hypothetical protein